MKSYSRIFIISGPSGAGEDSVIDGLAKQLPIERVITTTTRAPRAGESDGHPYYFISLDRFQQKIRDGEIAEYAKHYNDQFYGVTKDEIQRVAHSGKIGIWKIDYRGVATAKKMFSGIIAILITAPMAVMEQRIRTRDNVTEEYIAERMAYTREWLKHTDIYDYTIENEQGKLNEAVSKIGEIIKSRSAAAD